MIQDIKEQENYIRKNFSYASNITTDQVYENIKRFVKKRANVEDENPKEKRKLSYIGLGYKYTNTYIYIYFYN